MPHVLVAGQLHASGRAILEDAGLTVRYTDGSEADYAPLIGEADALLIRTQTLSAGTVANADRLKVVSRHGVGYDAVDVEALNARGIPLAVCGDVNSTSVAEHACMMILASAKRALRGDRAVREDHWTWRNGLEPQDIRGLNLLILGYGRIGQHTARMMAGFGLTIVSYDPFIAVENWPGGPASRAEDLPSALATADIVSVSAPKGDRPLIGSQQFAAMKNGVILVNTARGGTISEPALIDALHSGKVAAAGLDVFEEEPLPADHPLTAFDQVLLSPHIAGVTAGAAERMAIDSAENIIAFFAGALDPALVVNKDRIA